MKANKITLEQALLHELFDYSGGQLVWKQRPSKLSRAPLGEVAGGLHHSGYRNIKIYNVLYPAHRLVWIYHNGSIDDKLQIDHIDRRKDNNNISNLRLVTAKENSANRVYKFNREAA